MRRRAEDPISFSGRQWAVTWADRAFLLGLETEDEAGKFGEGRGGGV